MLLFVRHTELYIATDQTCIQHTELGLRRIPFLTIRPNTEYLPQYLTEAGAE